MTATSRCVPTSATFDATSAANATGGTHDTSVSTAAILTNCRRGRPLRRFRAAASSPPTTTATNATWVNPASGIIPLPRNASDTPAA